MSPRIGFFLAFLASYATAQITAIPRPPLAPETIGDANCAHASLMPIASDFSVANYRAEDQYFGLAWLREGEDNTRAAMRYFSVPANSGVGVIDFVSSRLGASGRGAMVVIAVDSLGNPNASANVELGPSIVMEPICSLNASISMRSSELGIVNLDRVVHTWTARSVLNSVPLTIAVPPFSVVHTRLDAAGTVVLKSDGQGFLWSGYGCSVDDVTGGRSIVRAK